MTRPSLARPRRGFALLAALWLVVAIAAVALQFALEARERRALGLAAADRGAARAAGAGRIAIARARLEGALRDRRVAGEAADALRAADPWLDAERLFEEPVDVGGVPVEITVRDLGTTLNVDSLPEDELRAFLAHLLDDYVAADALAQAIADWQDADDRPRPNGAERGEYLSRGRLVLPADRPVRDPAELLDVMGMTPEIHARLAPYLATRGAMRVHVNAAPEPVLRALPGMTDALVARILASRSAGRRLTSLVELVARPGGGRPVPGEAAGLATLARRLAFETSELEVTAHVRRGGVRLVGARAIVQRAGGTLTRVAWREW